MTSDRFVACVVLALVLPALEAWSAPPAPPPNVRITIEVGRLDGGKKAPVGHYEMVVSSGDENAKLLVGTRMPIPTSTSQQANASGGDTPVQVTSFTYQNVGLTADLRVVSADSARIHLKGSIEASFLRGPVPEHPTQGGPAMGTVSHAVDVSLRPGAPTRIVAVEEAGAGSFYLEMTADPVD
jgi:hypothetical protein